jgi:peptidoglycan/LPS O-acetylase OafA/YrhL
MATAGTPATYNYGDSTPRVGAIEFRAASRILELDGLRGLAILLVGACHYFGSTDHSSLGFWPHHLLTLLGFGWSGVDLFFVLSGFLIGGILLDARDSPRYFRTFYLRRAYRILPIYYFWIFLYVVIGAAGVWLLPRRSTISTKDFRVTPIYFVFLQNVINVSSVFGRRWFGVTWSLAVEEQFYLLAPWLLRWLTIRKLLYLLGFVIVAAPVARLLAILYLSHQYSLPQFEMPFRADTLSLGILAAVAWRSEDFRSFVSKHARLLQRSLIYLSFLIAGLLWWLVRPAGLVTFTIGFSGLGLFYMCLLLLAISQVDGFVARFVRAKWLRYLGGISYCVYLIHVTVNELAHALVLHAQPRISDLRGVAVTLIACLVT